MTTATEPARSPEETGPVPSPAPRRVRIALLVALTFGAGVIDIVGFLGMHQVFTANMTGNIVLFGMAAGEGDGAELARCGVATLAFALGLLLGFRLAGRGDPARLWPPAVTRALAADLVLQLVFLAGWAATGARPEGAMLLGLIALSSAAMGVQTAAARTLAADGITTTFVTGTLTSMMGSFAIGSAASAGLRTAVIGGLAAGAAAGGALMHSAPLAAAALGPVIVALVIAAAFPLHRRPA
ncbi:YoaK family protein [Spirillospora sp. NPDC029432]|uniref:YoaK family protein n=1 Tax=Spirillospora sp. NPDC029432 TaxID=3154599 RepID=UPI003453269A